MYLLIERLLFRTWGGLDVPLQRACGGFGGIRSLSQSHPEVVWNWVAVVQEPRLAVSRPGAQVWKNRSRDVCWDCWWECTHVMKYLEASESMSLRKLHQGRCGREQLVYFGSRGDLLKYCLFCNWLAFLCQYCFLSSYWWYSIGMQVQLKECPKLPHFGYGLFPAVI